MVMMSMKISVSRDCWRRVGYCCRGKLWRGGGEVEGGREGGEKWKEGWRGEGGREGGGGGEGGGGREGGGKGNQINQPTLASHAIQPTLKY